MLRTLNRASDIHEVPDALSVLDEVQAFARLFPGERQVTETCAAVGSIINLLPAISQAVLGEHMTVTATFAPVDSLGTDTSFAPTRRLLGAQPLRGTGTAAGTAVRELCKGRPEAGAVLLRAGVGIECGWALLEGSGKRSATAAADRSGAIELGDGDVLAAGSADALVDIGTSDSDVGVVEGIATAGRGVVVSIG